MKLDDYSRLVVRVRTLAHELPNWQREATGRELGRILLGVLTNRTTRILPDSSAAWALPVREQLGDRPAPLLGAVLNAATRIPKTDSRLRRELTNILSWYVDFWIIQSKAANDLTWQHNIVQSATKLRAIGALALDPPNDSSVPGDQVELDWLTTSYLSEYCRRIDVWRGPIDSLRYLKYRQNWADVDRLHTSIYDRDSCGSPVWLYLGDAPPHRFDAASCYLCIGWSQAACSGFVLDIVD